MKKLFAIVGLGLGISFASAAQSFTADPLGACAKIAADSGAQGVGLLILGIEGTMQYDSHDADALFAYSLASKGRPGGEAVPPLRNWGGILTDGLLFPLMREFGSEADAVSFDFDFNRDRMAAAACARTWMRYPGHKIMIVGHSSGGQEAVHFAKYLHANGVGVDTLVTIDALPLLGILSRPPGVARFLNFFQRKGTLRGQSAPADINVRVGDVAGHMTVCSSPTIYKYVSRRIFEELSPRR